MATLLKTALALCPLLALTAAWADDMSLEARTSVPQVTSVDGHAQNWRYLTVSLVTPLLDIEARLTTCTTPLRDNAAPQRAAASQPLTGCAGAQRAKATELMGQRLKALLPLPALFERGPTLDLSLRASATPRRAGHGSNLATLAELEITQALGPLQWSAGHAAPLNGARSVDPWQVTFSDLKWTPAPGHALTLSYEAAREIGTGERDRQASLRYAVNQGSQARWRFYATRYLDDAEDRWESGLGVDWAF